MLLVVTRCGENESGVQPPTEAHWSTRNQWKSSSLETRFPGVSRCGEHESGTQTPRNPIGQPETNGDRGRGKTAPGS